ncbi:MAG TPA: hypothetical protein PKY30_19150, partial [Myxococcota bacterium]|nr:hypothetical protein [Myxococcota bacterium]
ATLPAAAPAPLPAAVVTNGTYTNGNSRNGVHVGESQPSHVRMIAGKAQLIRDAKAMGYEGEACPDCGAMTMVRNGTCLKCVTCGATSGCS